MSEPVWVPVGPVVPSLIPTVYTKKTQKVLGNSGVATDMLNGEITIPQGVMTAQGLIEAVLHGTYANTGAGGVSEQFRIKIGGVTVFDSAPFNVTQSATRRAWVCRFRIVGKGVGAQGTYGDFVLGAAVPVTVGDGGPSAPVYASGIRGIASTRDFSAAAQALVFEWLHLSPSATVETTLDDARIEVS